MCKGKQTKNAFHKKGKIMIDSHKENHYPTNNPYPKG
jgi:hypothetical protein